MDQHELLVFVTQQLQQIGIRHFVTGSQAAMLYGEPRLTHDIDVVVQLRLGEINSLCAAFPEPDFYLSESAVWDAVEHDTQANILHLPSGLKVNLMHTPRTPFNESRFARARTLDVLGSKVTVAAPEDVILMELVHYREGHSEKHHCDITSILRVSPDLIDRSYS